MAKFVKGDVIVVPFPFILYRVGSLKVEKLAEIIDKVVEVIRK